MGDPPTPPIPKPRIEEIAEVSTANAVSQIEALKEQVGFSSGKESELKQKSLDWVQKYLFKWFLFLFVVGISAWWSISVLRIVWKSGTSGSSFHLSDSVLIALVSTSIANFLGLVVIVARHLFPGDPK
jgi:hypothetical protein